jgi:hypothetical protein
MSTMRPGQDRNERTLGQLVASATQDFATIIRGEIALAKEELSSQFKKAGMGGALLAAAGVIGFYSVYFIFITIAEGITAAGLPKWLSYLIVTVFFLLVAGILALLGARRLRKVQPTPKKAVAEAELTVAALKRATSTPYAPSGSRPVIAGSVADGSPAAAATTPTQAAHAAPVSASSAPGIAAGSPQARLADARTAEARAAAPGRPAPMPPPPGTPTTTTTSEHGWEETASEAVASGTGVEGPADLTDHPVMSSAPAASTAALPRTRAEAKAQAEAEARAHSDVKRRDNPTT